MPSIFRATKNVIDYPLFNFNDRNLLKSLKPYDPQAALTRYKGGGYLSVNAALREENPVTEDMARLINGIDEGLRQLPAYHGDTYRTVAFHGKTAFDAFTNEWKQGKIVHAAAYTSSSKGELYNNQLANPDVKYGAIMKLHSRTGRNMDAADFNNGREDEESEILFPRNTLFHVSQAAVSSPSPNKSILFLAAEEVQP